MRADTSPTFITQFAPLRAMLSLLAHATRADASILICGEAGSGKTLLARVILGWSDRAYGRRIVTSRACLEATLRVTRARAHPVRQPNPVLVQLPPLRDRAVDIPLLAEYFASRRAGTSVSLSGEAIDRLGRYGWPGNVRELRRVMHQTMRRRGGGRICGEDIDAVL